MVARPDSLYALVTSPYYIKYAMAAIRTGFRHLDNNLRELAVEGRGKNQYQGSLSLDTENDKTCTQLCVGFNSMDKIRTLAEILENEGKLGNGFVKQMDDKILTATTLGICSARWVNSPVKEAQIRISSPLLPHGSTERGTTKRRALYN